MKVNEAIVTNYKGVSKKDITPGKRTIFYGPNGAGKSSMIESLRYGVTGDYEGSPIRFGNDEASVEIFIDSGDVIHRTMKSTTTGVSNKVRVNGAITTNKSVDTLLSSWTDTMPTARKVITSAPLMRAMNGGELTDFLTSSGLLPLSVTIDDVLSWFKFSFSAETILRGYFPEAPEKITLENIISVYNEFKGEKTASTKSLKEEKAKAKWDKDVPTYSVESLDKTIEDLLDTKSKNTIYSAKKLAFEQAKLKRAEQEKQIEKLQKDISAMGSISAPNEEEKKNAEKQLKLLQEKINKLSGTIAVLQANIKSFEKMLDSLSGNVCPLSAKLTCSTDKSELVDEIKENITNTEKELEKALEEKVEKEGRKGIFESQLAAYSQKYDLYNKQLAVSAQIKALKGALVELPELPDKPSVTVDEDKIRQLKDQRRIVIEYAASLQAKKNAEDLEKKIEVLEEITSALNPKGGIREKVVELALSPLVEYCNNKSDEMDLGIKVSIESAGGTKIMCQTKNSGGFIALENASTGQQAIVMFLIMDMLNALSGLGILFLDGLETLDEEAFNALLTILESPDADATYNNIFVATVDHKDIADVIAKHPSWDAIKMA